MKAISFYLLLPFLYLISLSPAWLAHGISRLLYGLLYYIVGYRKKVVIDNLKNSFPDKSDAEISKITKKYYKYLADLMIETIQMLTMTPRQMRKRVDIPKRDHVAKHFAESQSIIYVMGHYGNWEWPSLRYSLHNLHTMHVIYKPLSNPYFDRLFLKMRKRFGAELTPMKSTLRSMTKLKDNMVTATAIVADQTPAYGEKGHWMTFLNQDTLVFNGTEKIAKLFNYPVYYVHIERVKRGKYNVHLRLIFENPRETKEHEITEFVMRMLEEEIHKHPETWLWSHRRWKHKRPPKSE